MAVSQSKKIGALQAIKLMKEKKRCEKLKGRKCTDGRPQICYIHKEEVSYTTISLDQPLTSIIIDKHEGRDLEMLM